MKHQKFLIKANLEDILELVISKLINRISSSIKADFVIYFIIANILIIASNIPLILRFLHTPQGMIFNFSHTPWDHDYNLYRSAIIQGMNGDWLYHDAFTSESTTPGIFYLFYIFVGKIASLFHLSSALAYHLARIASLEIFLILLYILTRTLLGKKSGLLAAFLALTGSISPLFFFKEKLEMSLAIPWWTNFDALERLNTLPHYIVAHNFLILSIILFIFFLRSRKIGFAIFSAISIFAGGISFPAVLTPISAALPISIIFLIVRKYFSKRKITINKRFFIGFSLIILSAFFSLLIIKIQELQGFPWNIWTSWNVIRWNYSEPAFNYNLFFVFGILPVIAIPAIIKNLRSGNIEKIFVTFWFVLPYILLPFVNLLQIPKLRLFEDAHFIPMAILASQTISIIISRLNSKIITIGLFVVFSIISIPVIVTMLQWRLSFIIHNFPPGVYYSNKSEYNGLDYIKKAVPKNSIILTSTAHILPAYAPVISYWGHLTLTNNFVKKGEDVKLFFSNQMDDTAAKVFLTLNNIDYIYQGPDERKLSDRANVYNFLRPVYRDINVSIYKFDHEK